MSQTAEPLVSVQRLDGETMIDGLPRSASARDELALREVRTGRVEETQMWGRTESVRADFKRLRAQ